MYLQLTLKRSLIILFILLFASSGETKEIFFSLKKNKVNVRYGPSLEAPIKYIYKKLNLPVKQIDKKENFRKIIDLKNNSGWIHISQLKKINSLIPLKDKVLFRKPSNFSRPLAKIKKGRVLIVQKCEESWCKIKSKNFKGWIKTDNVWGLVN
jgi:SH3-like domain-containing protein